MTYEMDVSENGAVLTLGGDLTLVNATALHSIFSDCLKKSGKIHVEFRNVSQADLSFLQLLCATHRSAVKMSKKFTTNGLENETLVDLVRRSGLEPHQRCFQLSDENCLWSGGNV